MSNITRRGPWSPEEDQKLMELISVFGPTNWVRISNSLVTRTPKQCRERYHQNLKPSLNRSPITPEEGELIEQLVLKYGKKWAEIARHLNGRSDNSIKNWWNGGASKRRRASVQHDKDFVIKENEPREDSGHIPSHLHTSPNNPNHIGLTQPYQHAMLPPHAAIQQVAPGSHHPTHGHLPSPRDIAGTVSVGNVHKPGDHPGMGATAGSTGSTATLVPAHASGNLAPATHIAHPHSDTSPVNGSGTTQQAATGLQSPYSGFNQYKDDNPKISFNTSMFNKSSANSTLDSISPPRGSERYSVLRSASFDLSNSPPSNLSTPGNQLPPLINKRRLFEDSYPSRRHSTATTNSMYSIPGYASTSNTSLAQSHFNLSSNSHHTDPGAQSPYNQSPLLLSNSNSRNNSISTTFDINLVGSNNNSSVNSRRSSIAPDFFPNPLKDMNHKRNVSSNTKSQNSIPPPLYLNQSHHFNVPSIGNSPTQSAFGLNKSSSNLSSNVLTASNVNNEKDSKSKADTKISVSSLID